jgi:hypothetical protein
LGDQSFKQRGQSVRSENDTIAARKEIPETGIIEFPPVSADCQEIGKFCAMRDQEVKALH